MSTNVNPQTANTASTPLPEKTLSEWWKTTIIRVDRLSSGQPRPYADSRYEARLTITDRDGRPVGWNESVIKPIVSVLVRKFVDKPQAERGWHESYLSSLVKENPGVWKATVIEPYLD